MKDSGIFLERSNHDINKMLPKHLMLGHNNKTAGTPKEGKTSDPP